MSRLKNVRFKIIYLSYDKNTFLKKCLMNNAYNLLHNLKYYFQQNKNVYFNVNSNTNVR